jgi:uncharacterized protein YecE (DUF72 family)
MIISQACPGTTRGERDFIIKQLKGFVLAESNTQIRIGTSSFSSKDWVGPFYPEDLKPSDFLKYYSQQFDTVEIDATYYRVPAKKTVESWAYSIPGDFLVSAKFPRAIVHAGQKATPDGDKLMVPDQTYSVRDAFLEALSRLDKNLGSLILQFPYLSQKVFADKQVFFERLERFLDDLPDGFSYGVEIRNRHWLTSAYAEILRARQVALVMADQAWMPHGDELAEKLDPVTSDHTYIRLIGDRREIEAITKTWEKEVLDRDDRLRRWAGMIARMFRRQVDALVYVNNHYAGHAPATARRLNDMIRAEFSRS